MRGFFFLPIVFAGVLASFGIYLAISANDLSGLLGSANSLASQIGSLRVPSDIGYVVSKYSDEKDSLYSGHLRLAWESAAKAQAISADIQRMAAGAKLITVDNKTVLSVDFSIASREAEARAYFDAAVKEAYLTLEGLINLLDSDEDALDLLGADNPNFTKSQVFSALYGLLDDLDAEIGRYDYTAKIEVSPCFLTGLKYETVCIIRQMGFTQRPAPEQAVDIFNRIIGYPGYSLLEGYFRYHLNLSSLMAEMLNDYDDSLRLYGQKVSEAEGKIDALKKDGILLIDSSTMNSVTGNTGSRLSVAAGDGEPLSESFLRYMGRLEEMKANVYIAERLFEQGQDDYLFLSTEKVRQLNFELSELSSSLDSAKESAAALLEKSHSLYHGLLEANEKEKTSALYLSALSMGQHAESQNTGAAIADYSRAITGLMFVQESNSSALNVDISLGYLSKTLASLEDFGVDVSYEKEQYKRLVKLDESSLYPETYASVQAMLSNLYNKVGFGLREIYEMRERLALYFADYHMFLQEPVLSDKLDKARIDRMEKYFENSLTFDELSNIGELFSKYRDMALYLEEQFNRLSSEYLSKLVTFSYDFPSNATCSELSPAKLLVSVRNPSSVIFRNATVSKRLPVMGDTDSVVFRIDAIGPGEIAYKEYSVSLWYNCSREIASNRTQVEKRFFDANNVMVKLCLFRDCSGLKKTYKEAYSALDIAGLEGALSEEIASFLADFGGKSAKKELDKIDALLKDFGKAVDSSVDFSHNVSLAFSEADHSRASSEYRRLKSVYDLISPVSLSSNSAADKFERLLAKFSPSDIADFSDSILALSDYLNSSIDVVRSEAKASLALAKKSFDETGYGLGYLKKGMDAYNKGNYNKAILLSSRVSETAGGTDLTYIAYLFLAMVLALFCVFLIRKPKEERRIIRRLMRATS